MTRAQGKHREFSLNQSMATLIWLDICSDRENFFHLFISLFISSSHSSSLHFIISQNQPKHLLVQFKAYIYIFQDVTAILKLIFQYIPIHFAIFKWPQLLK